MNSEGLEKMEEHEEESKDINKRYERIAWGCLFILIGILFLVPGHGDIILLGIGLVLVGLNLMRYRNGIPVSGVTIVIGIMAIFYSLVSILRRMINFPRIEDNIIPILLIAIGIYFIIVSIKKKKSIA